MTGLEKITNQILEEAKTSAAAVLEAAQKEAGEILEEAKKACEAIEAEADEKNALLRENYDGRVKSSVEQQRRTAILKRDRIFSISASFLLLYSYFIPVLNP